MPSPDLIAPDRLEELLSGVLPEGEREARLQGLVRELRTDAPAAPAPLRARVRALEEAPRRRRAALPRRRTALALAFVLLALAAIGAGIVFGGGGASDDDEAAPAEGRDVGAVDVGGAEEAQAPSALPQARTTLELKNIFSAAGEPARDAIAPLSPRGRATDVDLWVELRLADAEELSGAAGEAMSITRELGGWVAASDIDTQGREGAAELALRIPVGRVQDAVVRLSELGTITSQRVEAQDLQAGIDSRDRRIERLERSNRALELRLESGTLTPEQELSVRLQLERQRNAIADLRRANLTDRREAATSELTLLLHTREAAAREEKDEGGAAGAARDALDFLAGAGAVALFLAIVLSPILLLVVLLWLALRSRTRRIETRLLERSGPAAPPSTPRA